METFPCVTVIVPVYNVEKYLCSCIDSLLAQTFNDFEIILIDDGSNDGSSEICDRYANLDERVITVHKENGGVSSTRNKGIELARGKYIIFVDSDDTVSPEYVATLYKEIIDGDYDLVICGYKICRAKLSKDVSVGDAVCIDNIKESGSIISSLYSQRLLNSPWNKIYKKSSINSYFDETLAMGEDLAFNLNFIKSSNGLKVIPDILYNYIFHSGSAVATYKDSRMKDIITINNVLIDFFSTVFNTTDNVEKIKQLCINEIDGLFRHLFRGGNTIAERKNLINVWCSGEHYREFCKKYIGEGSILLADASKVYKFYNRKTWLERKIVKLLSR
jgi:glycosyltransferase involved in cell wall biosynthesis